MKNTMCNAAAVHPSAAHPCALRSYREKSVSLKIPEDEKRKMISKKES
jgi:hypothetical protein